MDARWRGFVAGMLMVTAIRSLMQDAMGKEDYIASIQYIWVEWYISVPVAVVLLLLALIATAPDTKKEGK